MIPMAENQQQLLATKPKVKQKFAQPCDPKSPLHPKNFHSNYGQASCQTKSESSDFISDYESLSSGHGRSEKDFSTVCQPVLLTKNIDYIPSVYALPISCSGNQSEISCGECESVIPPPKLNMPPTCNESRELYQPKCESSNVISDSESVSSGLFQSEKDFSVADLTFSPAKATDFIPSVYALPIAFSVANQTNVACDVPSEIPPPSLNAPIANQSKELSEISGECHLDLMQEKCAMQVNVGSSNIIVSQIEKSHKKKSEVIFGEDDIPLTQSPKLFLSSKVILNETESSSCEFVPPSPKDCDNKSFSFPDKTIFHNFNADVPTPGAYDESSTFRDEVSFATTILPPKHFNKSVLPTQESCLGINTQHKFEHVINQTTNLSVSKTSKQRKYVAKNTSIGTCDLFSGDYLNSLIELGAMSLNNSVNEPNSQANDKLHSDNSLQFVSDKTNCDSKVFTNDSNEDSLNEAPIMGYQEQYFKSCYVDRHNNDYSVECIKNIDSYEPNSDLYVCKPNSNQLAINKNVYELNAFCESSEGPVMLTNEIGSPEFKDHQSIALASDPSYRSDKSKAKFTRSESFPHNHSNATLENKITTGLNAQNKLFFKMPSKSIDSGLGSLSQENLTLSSSDIPSIFPEREKLLGDPVKEQVSNADGDIFSDLLQKCAFDDDDLSEMERIDNVVDNFFGLNTY